MYVPGTTYLATCSFIAGYRWGSGDESLDSFRSWLVSRGRARPELGWPWLVLSEIYPTDRLPDIANLNDEQNQQAVEVLFALLEEFFESQG